MLVVHKLDLPKMFVIEIGGTPALETGPEAARVQKQLQVPLLEGYIVVIFSHLLRMGLQESPGEKKGRKQPPKDARRKPIDHTTTLFGRCLGCLIIRIMAVRSTFTLRVTRRKECQTEKNHGY